MRQRSAQRSIAVWTALSLASAGCGAVQTLDAPAAQIGEVAGELVFLRDSDGQTRIDTDPGVEALPLIAGNAQGLVLAGNPEVVFMDCTRTVGGGTEGTEARVEPPYETFLACDGVGLGSGPPPPEPGATPTSNEAPLVISEAVVLELTVQWPDGQRARYRWRLGEPAVAETPTATHGPNDFDVAWRPLHEQTVDAGLHALSGTPNGYFLTGSGIPRPNAWYSSDGESWHQAEFIGFTPSDRWAQVDLSNAYEVEDRLLLFGSTWLAGHPDGLSMLYASSDEGRTWRPLEDANPIEAAFVSRVVRFGDRYIAAGRTTTEPMETLLWTSMDGIAWQLAPSGAGGGAFAGCSIADLAAGDDAVVAVGTCATAAGFHATFWRSTDGLTWQSATAAEPRSDAFAVVHAQEGFVAVGAYMDGPEHGAGAIWVSADGEVWRPAGVDARGAGGFDEVAAAGSRFTAVGWGQSGPVVASATDLDSWTSAMLPGETLALQVVVPITSGAHAGNFIAASPLGDGIIIGRIEVGESR